MYQHPGARQAIQKWDSLPHVTFINRIGDEVADDGGCAIGGEFVQVDSEDLFANKKSCYLWITRSIYSNVFK